MGVMLTQTQYARLWGFSPSKIAYLRKEGYIWGWEKMPNGRVMIPADARTRFSRPGVEDTPARIREDWDRHFRYVGYKRGTEWRKAMREVLQSTEVLAKEERKG